MIMTQFQIPKPKITDAKYTIDGSVDCIFNDKHVIIPCDDTNAFYQELIKWLEEGNEIQTL